MGTRFWTEAEDNAVLVLFADGAVPAYLVRSLAQKLDRTYLAVKLRALKLGCDGIDQFPYVSVQSLARETGYSPSRIKIAIERLGIALRAYGGKRKDGTPRVLSIPKTRIPDILAECQKAPDGGLLNASKHGEWGKRGKFRMNPEACLDCGRNDKAHYSKGFCHACYSRQYKKQKVSASRTRGSKPDAA
jgi:hypothetical protein